MLLRRAFESLAFILPMIVMVVVGFAWATELQARTYGDVWDCIDPIWHEEHGWGHEDGLFGTPFDFTAPDGKHQSWGTKSCGGAHEEV
jgi:hypothetical protein